MSDKYLSGDPRASLGEEDHEPRISPRAAGEAIVGRLIEISTTPGTRLAQALIDRAGQYLTFQDLVHSLPVGCGKRSRVTAAAIQMYFERPLCSTLHSALDAQGLVLYASPPNPETLTQVCESLYTAGEPGLVLPELQESLSEQSPQRLKITTQ